MQAKPETARQIPFADNLAESLPASYIGNLALLTKEQNLAIAEDFRRWRLSIEWFEKRRLAKTKLDQFNADTILREFLARLEPQAYRDDMRRRLNYQLRKLKNGGQT